jgi:uncharacterized protein YqeY
MSLREQLQRDLQDAIRAQDETRKAALRMVLLSVQLGEAESGSLSDEEITELIQKEVKRREEALELVRQAGREDLVATDTAELDILRAYLPEPLSSEELREMVRAAIAEAEASAPSDLGKVMRVVMPRVKGRADGASVNAMVRALLSE